MPTTWGCTAKGIRDGFEFHIRIASCYKRTAENDVAETIVCLPGIPRDTLFAAAPPQGGRPGIAGVVLAEAVASGGAVRNSETGGWHSNLEGAGKIRYFPLSIRRAKPHRHVGHETGDAGGHSRLAQAGVVEGGRHRD